jgi:nucleoside-diphosphate-sugar epimerase
MASLPSSPPPAAGRSHPQAEGAIDVVVTGASGQVGRAFFARLLGAPLHTVALVQGAHYVHASRLLSGSLHSPPSAQALHEAEVIVHLAGALRPQHPNHYRAANVHTTQAVAQALRHGRARRVLFLSYVGAREDSRNEYLRTKAEAERLLATTGKEVVVFRCTHIIGPPEAPGPTAQALIAPPTGRVTVLGRGSQRVQPVFVGDVAAALAAAVEGGAPGTYDLAGPERMSLDELATLLNRGRDVHLRHLASPLARALAQVWPKWPPALVDLMLRNSLGETEPTMAAFSLRLTSLRDVWG